MASNHDAKPGLALDKINMPKAKAAFVPPELIDDSNSTAENSTPAGKTSKLPIMLSISGVFFMLSIVFILWNQALITLPFLSKSRHESPHLERFATIGPLMASIGGNQHIKFTVMIECDDNELKERLAALEAKIKNSFLRVFNSPEVKEILKNQHYESLKPFFIKKINKMLKDHAIENIYFSQIVRY
jgi:flagellar basal body-associated protein FliL